MSNYVSSKLSSQQLRFANENEDTEDSGALPEKRTHSRAPSKGNAAESPPLTPRTKFTFGSPGQPPIPPSASSLNTTFTPSHTPTGSLAVPHTNVHPFPEAVGGSTTHHRSGTLSSPPSQGELLQRTPRKSTSTGTGSRPNTAGEYGMSASRPASARFRETFALPRTRPLTMYSSVQNSSVKIQRERPRSTMLTDEKRDELQEVKKPWTEGKDPYMRISYFLTYGMIIFGILAGGVRCFFEWRKVPMMKGNLCPVMEEHFTSEEGVFGENGKFFREVDMSGFGNGEFEMTTTSPKNSYVRDGYLYITPTLTSDDIGEAAIEDGHVFNITDCTFNITQGLSYTAKDSTLLPLNISAVGIDREFDVKGYTKACSAVSNATSGAVINPVQSARLSTRRSASIRFGKVEVRAKIPTGDWLWPAIWMLPVDNVYGGWPMSGEIDIMEARGNGPKYATQGSNYVRGSLNWGPNGALNAAYKTYGWWSMRRGSYDEAFHTYSLEWDEDFIRIYVDSRLHHLLDIRVKKSFWELGEFPPMISQGSESAVLHNIWVNGSKAAPFDQNFYLILDVGVGGTNGWFPDAKEKPWYDGSQTAMGAFWRARHEWLPTWPTEVEKRSLVVDYVKMWQKC
ncbi:concanavalin A-like lectin/glucanase domain-containing protein [Ephemerocybe angulata]|uniref:Concanavalin A-like lectin/glucanase domain-containing protein n=1 Tax=Ephemerocybe angulata TaxID=980116 RepID=A0A8H6M582_9AGAR|nr:concanavalin A-like lectin/glucanase domain-containing protein [Tulosesus angulatus]